MIKKLMKYIGEYTKFAVMTPILVSLEVVAEVIIPVLMARLIDFGVDAGDMGYIIRIGIALLAMAALALFFGAMAGKTAAIGSAGFAKNLRKGIFYNVQNFSFSNIDKFSVAGIVTRLTSDVSNVQQSFQMITRMAIRAPIMMIFSLIVSFGIDSKLSFIFVGCMPFLAVGLFFIIKNAHPIFMRVFKTYDKLNGVVEENLKGIRVVKSFNRE
ncbi:MAG: ABC transporter permease, partial [Oscillospiraceae bacterium]